VVKARSCRFGDKLVNERFPRLHRLLVYARGTVHQGYWLPSIDLEEIEAGTVWFNDPLTDNEAAPFGGFKASGTGRELGPEGLEGFRAAKHVPIDSKMDAKAWWYPYAEYVRHQAEHGTAPG
jgi:hypothetical protein